MWQFQTVLNSKLFKCKKIVVYKNSYIIYTHEYYLLCYIIRTLKLWRNIYNWTQNWYIYRKSIALRKNIQYFDKIVIKVITNNGRNEIVVYILSLTDIESPCFNSHQSFPICYRLKFVMLYYFQPHCMYFFILDQWPFNGYIL